MVNFIIWLIDMDKKLVKIILDILKYIVIALISYFSGSEQVFNSKNLQSMWQKKPLERTMLYGSEMLGLSKETTFEDVVSDDDSIVIKKAVVKSTDLKNVVMPTSAEFDLAEQLKAGVKPEQINVHGMLDNGSFDVNSAFASLQKEVSEKDDSNKEGVIDFKNE